MKSQKIHEPIAGSCSTIGKIPLATKGHTVPSRMVSATGARFTDEHNRVWLDFDMALGTVIWGHGRKEFGDVIRDALIRCGTPSVPSMMELDAAQCLLKRLNTYEQLRFFKTGSDACSAAVRIARAAANRPYIATDGYHGWHDWSVAWAYPDDPRVLGVLDAVKAAVRFLDPSHGVELAKRTITAIANRLAAIIIRPEAWSPQAIGEFSGLCRQTGIILIFDEVTSHFKYGRHGAAGKLGIWPDLLCISKGLANGLPLSALLGSEALMRHANSARISTTYASECTALAALMVGEHLMAQSPSWPVWQREMELVVQGIQRQIYALDISSELEIVQHPGFFSIQSKGKPFRDDPFRYYLVGHLADHGIFTRGWFHGSDNHTPADWQSLQRALSDSLSRWVQR